MAERQEPGYAGQLVSLGGFKAAGKDRGRQVESRIDSLNNNGVVVMPANSRRISGLIYIAGTTAVVAIALGDVTTGSDYSITLNTGDSFQIDYNLPWTGVVTAYTAGMATIYTTEISVP